MEATVGITVGDKVPGFGVDSDPRLDDEVTRRTFSGIYVGCNNRVRESSVAVLDCL